MNNASYETIINKSAIFCEGKLNESDYNTKLKYTAVINNKINKKARKRNFTWFTIPYSEKMCLQI